MQWISMHSASAARRMWWPSWSAGMLCRRRSVPTATPRWRWWCPSSTLWLQRLTWFGVSGIVIHKTMPSISSIMMPTQDLDHVRLEFFHYFSILRSIAIFKKSSDYLNVINSCSNSCSNPVTCVPCANLQYSKYSVVVSNNVLFNASANAEKYLGTCPDYASKSMITSKTDGSFVVLTLNAVTTNKYISVCGAYTYFKVYMPDPCSDLNIEGDIQSHIFYWQILSEARSSSCSNKWRAEYLRLQGEYRWRSLPN